MHLPDAPEPATPWAPWQPNGPAPAPPPPPPPPPPPAPVPAGKKWQCYPGTSVPSHGSDWVVPSLHLSGIDYIHGLTGVASCEGICNGCYNGTGGCLAMEYHFTDKHCVCYSGASLEQAAFEKILTNQTVGTWSSCMLVRLSAKTALMNCFL